MFPFLNKKVKESCYPNILITNYCNQNCEFCFARDVMESNQDREMSLQNYIGLIGDLKNEGVKNIYLMGGEPTLHKNFKEIINETINLGLEIHLFTNCFFNSEIEKFLISKKNKICTYHINIATPGYRSGKIRKDVLKFIEKIKSHSKISLEITIDSLEKKKYLEILDSINKSFKNVSVRIGVDGYFLKRNGFDLKKYKMVGQLIESITEYLIERSVNNVWLSEVYGCMFDERWLSKMDKSGRFVLSGFGCLSKRAGVDIKTNMKVIRCFSLDPLNGIEYRKNKLIKIKNILDNQMIKKSKRSLPSVCKKCQKHGYSDGKCPGPCLVGE